jgi:hypothetical protein
MQNELPIELVWSSPGCPQKREAVPLRELQLARGVVRPPKKGLNDTEAELASIRQLCAL